MNTTISNTVDSRFVEEKLPVAANIKVIRKNDPNYGLSEDEIQDREEFIRCYLLQDFELLMMIPKQTTEDDFFTVDCTVDNEEYSAFNTHDFQRQQRPFNRYHYAMKKIMERVKDLAIMHSCISSSEDRQMVYERFKSFMAFKFVDEVEELARQLHHTESYNQQPQIRRKIEKLSREIRNCMKIWERYAPPENWDR